MAARNPSVIAAQRLESDGKNWARAALAEERLRVKRDQSIRHAILAGVEDSLIADLGRVSRQRVSQLKRGEGKTG